MLTPKISTEANKQKMMKKEKRDLDTKLKGIFKCGSIRTNWEYRMNLLKKKIAEKKGNQYLT